MSDLVLTAKGANHESRPATRSRSGRRDCARDDPKVEKEVRAALSHLENPREGSRLARDGQLPRGDPRLALAWSNKGAALSDLGRKQKAIGCCDRDLEIDPRFALAWGGKGAALSGLGRQEEAVEAYRQFVACAPASYKQGTQWAEKLIAVLEASFGKPM